MLDLAGANADPKNALLNPDLKPFLINITSPPSDEEYENIGMVGEGQISPALPADTHADPAPTIKAITDDNTPTSHVAGLQKMIRKELGESKETLMSDNYKKHSTHTIDRVNNELYLHDFERGSIISETENDEDSQISGEQQQYKIAPKAVKQSGVRVRDKGVVIAEMNKPGEQHQQRSPIVKNKKGGKRVIMLN